MTTDTLHLITQIRQNTPSDKPIYDMRYRGFRNERYYQTNTRGIMIQPPSFYVKDLAYHSGFELFEQSKKQCELFDQVLVELVKTEKFQSLKVKDVSNICLRVEWYLADHPGLLGDLDLRTVINIGANYLSIHMDKIKPMLDAGIYLPLPWIIIEE